METTPKEKAQQLFDKVESFIYTSHSHFAEDNCEKKCAMIVADEVIKAMNLHEESYQFKYWVQVKKELSLM